MDSPALSQATSHLQLSCDGGSTFDLAFLSFSPWPPFTVTLTLTSCMYLKVTQFIEKHLFDISAWALLFPGTPVPTVAALGIPALCLHSGGFALESEDWFSGQGLGQISSTELRRQRGLTPKEFCGYMFPLCKLHRALGRSLMRCYWVLIGLMGIVGETRRT